jgi:hypothetical protein
MKFHTNRSWTAILLGFWLWLPGANAAPQSVISKPPEVEPSYCDPAQFDEAEIPYETVQGKGREPGLFRAHAFRLGKVTLVGLGVGDSPVEEVIRLSKRLVPENKAPNYCTWYLNHAKSPKDRNKKLAASTFIHRNIEKNPMLQNEEQATTDFMQILSTSFDQGTVNFTSCVSEQHYLALGCNGMEHRGPTVFGMILAFSGCSPVHSLEIANQIWGLNGVKRKVRLAIIQKAHELGQIRKESRKRLSEAFLSQ